MLSGIARIMLTTSAIAPVGFTYSFVAFTQNEPFIGGLSAIFSVASVLICLVIFGYARENIESTVFKATSIEASDRETVGLMLLYLLPLFTDKINTLNWSLWIPTLLVFGIVTATGYSYHFNPLLGILGWHFYKISGAEGVTYVLITKKHLRNISKSLRVGQLTEYTLLDLGDSK
ncbi:hypothetical protein [Teichococcus aestuarii]|uniref:hypothetical protein n=1 Tax=Teichococcus aestuarii TaxID=568898 RepID=UPI00361B4F1E